MTERIVLTLAPGQDVSNLDGKTFQVHILPDGRMRLALVTLIRPDDRCPVIVGGERCGCRPGHAGKHMWAGGD